MQAKSAINLGLFLVFAFACFYVRGNKEFHEAIVKAAPYVRISLEYTMIYLFAFKGAKLFPGWNYHIKGVTKYLIAAACMILIKRLVILHTMNEVYQYFTTGKFTEAFAMKDLVEIGINYVIQKGYAKLSRIPFFLTAHLWVIYYVSSYMFYQEVLDNYSHFKQGFVIVHDTTLGSMRKFTRITHELPMVLALAGLHTFNFEVELLVVSVINHLLTIVVGYWTISNHNHPYVQSLIMHLSPYVAFRTRQLQFDITYFAICLTLSVQVHYWWTLSEHLAKIIGNIHFAIDPWTIRRVRIWRDNTHGICDFVKDGILHTYKELIPKDQRTLEAGNQDIKVTYSVGMNSVLYVDFDGSQHAY